jgi:hypothetical protein
MSSRPDESRSSIVYSALVVEGGLVIVALGLGWLFAQPPLAQIDWTIRAAWLALAAATPMIAALVLVTRWPVGPFVELEEVARRSIVPLFRSCTLLDLAAISALAGLGEEMLFRGVVQTGLERASGSPWLALVLASLLFGLAHPITLAYAVLAGLIGVYLGWLFMATDNLLVPIVTHAAYDFVALVYLVRGGQPPPADDYGDEWLI